MEANAFSFRKCISVLRTKEKKINKKNSSELLYKTVLSSYLQKMKNCPVIFEFIENTDQYELLSMP